MATVKILYVRNLMLQTTEETIEKEFNSLKEGTGQITGRSTGIPFRSCNTFSRSEECHLLSLWCCFVMVANAGITLGCRRSGASEEDQRLCLCALRPARRCHPRHEGAQWKGLLPCRHNDEPASSQQNHHFLRHPVGGWFTHRGHSCQAGGQGQLCAVHQRNRRTGRISAD